MQRWSHRTWQGVRIALTLCVAVHSLRTKAGLKATFRTDQCRGLSKSCSFQPVGINYPNCAPNQWPHSPNNDDFHIRNCNLGDGGMVPVSVFLGTRPYDFGTLAAVKQCKLFFSGNWLRTTGGSCVADTGRIEHPEGLLPLATPSL